MAKKFAELQRIDNNCEITQDSDYRFLYHLQKGLLLALRERGILNTIQYRHAEERLTQQLRGRAKMLVQKGRVCDQSCELLPCVDG